MAIDRNLQRLLLEHLRDVYPHTSYEMRGLGDWDMCVKNLFYLAELGLIRLDKGTFLDGRIEIHGATITAKGIDFLEDDGGVGAILGTVTFKLHEDTLQKLISAKILDSDLPDEEKGRLVAGVKELSGEATKHLTMKLIDEGLAHLPRAIEIVGSFLR
jgi:hypothetical protein